MSRRATHTPGPWHAEEGGNTINVLDAAGGFIAEINTSGDQVIPDMQANARVIAAAPDMLAELQRLYLKHGEAHTGAVIAKATGQAS